MMISVVRGVVAFLCRAIIPATCTILIPFAASAVNIPVSEPHHGAEFIFEAMDIGGVDARTAALLLSGQEGGNVDGAVLWTLGGAHDEARTEIRFVVEVDGASLISGLMAPRIAIAVLAYVVDETGEIVEHIAQGVILDSQAHAARLTEAGFKFIGGTRLAPGKFNLRVMVREQDTGHFFLSSARIEVPPQAMELPYLQPPVFEEEQGHWVVTHQDGLSLGDGSELPTFRVPSARPVLIQGRSTDFRICPLLRDVHVSVDASIVDSAGHVVAEFPVELSERPSERSGWVSATLPPMDLPPGQFTLNLTVREPESADEVRQEISVVSSGAADTATWIAVRHARSTATVAETAAREPGKFRRRRVRAGYLAALRDLAVGEDLAARRAVTELETAALISGSLRNMRWIEDAVASDLAEQNPLSLLPVALLHQQMVRRYVAHRQFVLANFAREVTADRASEIGKAGVGDGFAEALLVNLANDLSRTAAASSGRDYLERALSLNPSYRPALLALGASLERAAEYDRAARVFRDLVETDPDRNEGRLRLAINLERSGRRDAAAHLLDALLSRPVEEWIAVIAAQERARLYANSQRYDEALSLLDSSIRRYPDDQRLRIQYAWMLDRSKHSLDAVAAILEIPPPRSEASPRLRYGEWPDLGFEVSARKLHDDATVALPELTAALDALEQRQ